MKTKLGYLLLVLFCILTLNSAVADNNGPLPGTVEDLTTTTHGEAIGQWHSPQSGNAEVTVTWTAPPDTDVGGYSIVWDTNPNTLPGENIDLGPASTQTTSPQLQDGKSHYFHIRVVDDQNNWSGEAAHLGPFWIDTTPPAAPESVATTSHPDAIGDWNDPQSQEDQVVMTWDAADDPGEDASGIAGYSIVFDDSADTVPDNNVDVQAGTETVTSAALADGVDHWFHIVAVDKAGNTSDVVHVGPFWIDTEPPKVESAVASPNAFKHGDTTITIIFEDDLSGMSEEAPTVTIKTDNDTIVSTNDGTVSYSPYSAGKKRWTGKFTLDEAQHGQGSATIRVTGMRDKAGNVADNDNAGGLMLAANNPVSPVENPKIMHSFGQGYGWHTANPGRRIHEGVDYQDADGTVVRAARDGVVHDRYDAGNAQERLVVRVQIGPAVYHYDYYLHMTTEDGSNTGTDYTISGTAVAAGTQIGVIGPYYLPDGQHLHFTVAPTVSAVGYPSSFDDLLNPLSIFIDNADRDPGKNDPVLFDSDSTNSGRAVTYYRKGASDHELENDDRFDTATHAPDPPDDSLYGDIRIVAELGDDMEYNVRTIPYCSGYWIETQMGVGENVRSEDSPYILTFWDIYDVGLDNDDHFDEAYDHERPGEEYGPAPWRTRYGHVVSNAGDVTGREEDRDPSEEWWKTDARVNTGNKENMQDAEDARCIEEAHFADGLYRVYIYAADLRGEHHLTDEDENDEPMDVVVNNFPPHVAGVVANQDGDNIRYDAAWVVNEPVTGRDLLPEGEDRRPSWVNGQHDLNFTITFSEPMEDEDSPTLRIKNKDDEVMVYAMESDDDDRILWTATIPQANLNDEHQFDRILTESSSRPIVIEGQDLAGTSLDISPESLGVRTGGITVGAETWAGYDNTANAGWLAPADVDDPVVDLNHTLKVDTKHNVRPVPALAPNTN